MSLFYTIPIMAVLLNILLRPFYNKENRKRYLLVLAIVVVIILSLRDGEYDYGGDLNNYYRFFQTIKDTPWPDLLESNQNIEVGYRILNKILGTFFPWNQSIIVFEAVFVTGIAFWFINNNTDDVFLGSLVYLSVISLIFAMTAFRQAMAISFLLLSVEMIKGNRLIWSLIFLGLAVSMHQSAIVFIPILFMSKRKLNNNILIVLSMAYIVSLLFMNKLLQLGNNLFGFSYVVTGKVGNVYGGIVVLVIIALALYLSYEISKKDGLYIVYYMGMMAFFVYSMQFYVHSFERIAFYFFPAIGPLLGQGLNYNNKLNDNSKRCLYYLVCFLLIVYFYHSFSKLVGDITFLI